MGGGTKNSRKKIMQKRPGTNEIERGGGKRGTIHCNDHLENESKKKKPQMASGAKNKPQVGEKKKKHMRIRNATAKKRFDHV